MHNKDKDIFKKKLPYEYNICLYILEELCDKGVIDVFEMTEAIILLRKKYKMPVISIYCANKNCDDLIERIERFPARLKINKSSWLIKTNYLCGEIIDEFMKQINSNDMLFVPKLTGQSAWTKVESNSSEIKIVFEPD